mmetsp:Transcript_38282/g.108226  ORF Transcript_38282/g.108226 Transcript_38282/m.108226 type:complete len:113 (-) Transcript_38282:487-825(-)
MDQQELRQLKIKTGSVKRLRKELTMYEKEHTKEIGKVEKMKAENADSHDIKHAENVLSEAAMMLPDCRQRLEAALGELVTVVGEIGDSVSPEDCKELVEAKEVIADAETVFA